MEIVRRRYEELVIAEVKLTLLEDYGVDNWEGYGDALQGIDEAKKTALMELSRFNS